MFGRNEDKRYVKVSEQNLGMIRLYTVVDSETGVNYLIVVSGNGTTITPLLDRDGKVKVDNGY